MLAAQLDERTFDVGLYEQDAALGRKFLVAGNGGFNLTHAEPLEDLVSRYNPTHFLEPALRQFSNTGFRHWLNDIGIPTYTGTSNRVFPLKGTRPIGVLNAVLKQLADRHVKIYTQHRWSGFAGDNALLVDTPGGTRTVKADIVVFSLGGSSWKVTGSNGLWTEHFEKKKISCVPFQASNCAFGIEWPEAFIDKAEGQALKNCIFTCDNTSKKGEAVLTRFGIEGSGVYPLSPEIRSELSKEGTARLYIDLKPMLSGQDTRERIAARGNASLSKCLEQDLKLSAVSIGLLKAFLSKEEFTEPASLASKIKRFPLRITSLAHLDDAISTVGGLALNEVDATFQLKKLPGNYAIGEMLDWDAPTGGYLLQACFSMGYSLAAHLNASGA